MRLLISKIRTSTEPYNYLPNVYLNAHKSTKCHRIRDYAIDKCYMSHDSRIKPPSYLVLLHRNMEIQMKVVSSRIEFKNISTYILYNSPMGVNLDIY